jgi:tRNA A37 threonylcarbamoyladenosine dehydratase
MFTEKNISEKKIDILKREILKRNSDTTVIAIDKKITRGCPT